MRFRYAAPISLKQHAYQRGCVALLGIVGRMFTVNLCGQADSSSLPGLARRQASCLNYQASCENACVASRLPVCRYAKQQIFTCFRPVHTNTPFLLPLKHLPSSHSFHGNCHHLEWVVEGKVEGCLLVVMASRRAITTYDLVMAGGVHQLYCYEKHNCSTVLFPGPELALAVY